jgi:hypothetical protein
MMHKRWRWHIDDASDFKTKIAVRLHIPDKELINSEFAQNKEYLDRIS